MARIALDAMGGDFAPEAPITGALLALDELAPAHSIQLVGRASVIADTLERLLATGAEHAPLARHRDRLTLVDAPDVIEMSDKPTSAPLAPWFSRL